MNILFLATYGDFLATFELSNIKIWKSLGCKVFCASNFSDIDYNVKTHRLDEAGVSKIELKFARKPFSPENKSAYKKLVKIIKDNKIEIIDCHNAVIGAYARIAASQCGVKKVIYTPHSFFFYKGCPIKNNIIYKNVESYLARKTDLLISINKEDYEASLKMKIRGKALYVPGIGVDTKEMFNLTAKRETYCSEFCIPINAQIYISVGELISRKNHISAIKAFAKANLDNAYYIICGIGELESELESLIMELGMENRIKLLGYRLDVKSIMKISDVFLFPSFQEGLPVALMEAMACGLPCIASNIRGNVDLIDEGKGGLLFDPFDYKEMSGLIQNINGNLKLQKMYGEYNQEKIIPFDISNIQKIMLKEYKKLVSV